MSTHHDDARPRACAWLFAYRSRMIEEAEGKIERRVATQDRTAEEAAAQRGWLEDADLRASPEECIWDRMRHRWDEQANELGWQIDALLERTGRSVEEVVDPLLMMSLPELLACAP
jgi:hypothetical protein